jgi:hypothetical protein
MNGNVCHPLSLSELLNNPTPVEAFDSHRTFILVVCEKMKYFYWILVPIYDLSQRSFYLHMHYEPKGLK